MFNLDSTSGFLSLSLYQQQECTLSQADPKNPTCFVYGRSSAVGIGGIHDHMYTRRYTSHSTTYINTPPQGNLGMS